jgi:hypothetical protein
VRGKSRNVRKEIGDHKATQAGIEQGSLFEPLQMGTK